MEIKVNKEANNTYKVDVTVEKEIVTKHLDEALKHESENIEIKGFRKGTAPIAMVKDMIDPSKVRGHALNHLLPDIYKRIVTENKLSPIIGPRIEIKEMEEGKDLLLTITIVEKPEIEIGDYKKTLKELGQKKAKQMADKPAQADDAKAKDDASTGVNNQEVIDTIIAVSKIAISEVIIQEEVANMVTNLISQTEQMGVTIDQYATAHNKTVQQIRDDYKVSAENIIKADFIISEIARMEGIIIADSMIDDLLKMMPDEKSRAQMENPEQRLYIKAVMLKNETLQKLARMANGEKEPEQTKPEPTDNTDKN